MNKNEYNDDLKVSLLILSLNEIEGMKVVLPRLKKEWFHERIVSDGGSTDGSIEYETVSRDLYVPRNRVGKGLEWKRFKVQLPNELSKDSRICMTVHSGSH